LFAHFLRHLGFPVNIVASQVWRTSGKWAPEWDHFLLIVTAEHADWIIDVGYPNFSAVRPVRIERNIIQKQDGWKFRVDDADGHSVLLREHAKGRWVPVYRFCVAPLSYAYLRSAMNREDPSLTSILLCSRGTPEGKITVMREKILRYDGGRETIGLLTTSTLAETALREVFQDHDHLVKDALRIWERTRRSSRGPLPGIG
jgi:arylamine N-acetyltransferase